MKTLVIGYGHSLRGDDGVGPLVAEQIAAWNLPDVRSLCVHQLTPELAAEMAQVEQVLFVDACLPNCQRQSPPILKEGVRCKIERLFPATFPHSLDHSWSSHTLLYLAKTLYNADPIAYQILIPAMQFDYGEPLSAIARAGASWVLGTLASEAWLRRNPARISGSVYGTPHHPERQRCMKLV
ncbi:MAG: hydrogenase maturation protease [Acaryochloris sp. CRU_2_0]|nr:hydrogenase maturation protease [Acaryochloris sp. CRU_2_0]